MEPWTTVLSKLTKPAYTLERNAHWWHALGGHSIMRDGSARVQARARPEGRRGLGRPHGQHPHHPELGGRGRQVRVWGHMVRLGLL